MNKFIHSPCNLLTLIKGYGNFQKHNIYLFEGEKPLGCCILSLTRVPVPFLILPRVLISKCWLMDKRGSATCLFFVHEAHLVWNRLQEWSLGSTAIYVLSFWGSVKGPEYSLPLVVYSPNLLIFHDFLFDPIHTLSEWKIVFWSNLRHLKFYSHKIFFAKRVSSNETSLYLSTDLLWNSQLMGGV